MSGSASISAAKRRRAGSDFNQNMNSNVKTPQQQNAPNPRQMDLNNPNQILAIHDRLMKNCVDILNNHTSHLNNLEGKMQSLAKSNDIISKKVVQYEKRIKELEQEAVLREGHVDDKVVDSDDDGTNAEDLGNVSFSVKE
jgi:hypothetical protein